MQRNIDEKVLLGIDIGTSSCKYVAIDLEGRIVAQGQTAYPTYYPCPTWAEQDANDWWSAVKRVIKECVHNNNINNKRIVAVSVDSHLEAFICLDKHGNALTRGMLWMDRRAVREVNAVLNIVSQADFIKKTGVPVDYLHLAPRIFWIRKNLPKIYRQTSILLSPKDYITFKLTGEKIIDYSVASKTGLFDIRNRRWLSIICDSLEIPLSILPEPRGAWEKAGEVSEAAASETGLKKGTLIAVGGGDDHCQALAGGVLQKGEVNISTGTGSCWKILVDAPKPDLKKRLECHCYVIPDKWVYWTGIHATGYSVYWFIKNVLNLISEGYPQQKAFNLLEKLAAGIQPGADGLFYLPYLWGARIPKLIPSARGGFFGFTYAHNRSHFYRAILEGVGFHHRIILDILNELGIEIKRISMTGNEVKSHLWSQIKADILGYKILIPKFHVGAAVGSAILAGLATGYYRHAEEAVRKFGQPEEIIEPNQKVHQRYEELYIHYRKLLATLRPLY